MQAHGLDYTAWPLLLGLGPVVRSLGVVHARYLVEQGYLVEEGMIYAISCGVGVSEHIKVKLWGRRRGLARRAGR